MGLPWQLFRRKEIPNFQELMADPQGTLARKEIRIQSRSLIAQGLYTALVGLLCVPLLFLGHWTTLFIVLLISCVVGAGFFIGLGVWYGRPEIVLREKGVTIHDGHSLVFCPWELFNAPGTPFGRPGIPEQVLVPVAPHVVPLIELRIEGRQLGYEFRHGVRHLLTITKPNEIRLSGWYAVSLVEVGTLFLHLGRSLAPQESEQPESDSVASTSADLSAACLQPEKGDWITVSLTQLEFPEACCRCCAPTDTVVTYHLEPRWSWLWSIITHVHEHLEVPLPVCERCHANDRRRRWCGILTGLAVGSLLVIIPAAINGEDIRAHLFSFVSVGALLGGFLGWLIMDRPPVSVRRYSARQGSVTIRFRNHAYTDLFLRYLALPQPIEDEDSQEE